ncbi:putative sulfate exporter family transporter [Desulfomonile tiedjei]|uniref:Putative membrane protein n=1 Tax=Desulfomonile tiedjei (strain ATCC 49306 / DSM 6799 / DCB-1) TaxID=706587 RepID=I4C2P6_DESTA|nr:putative sulfate exporter family transporter [Desulfomonile tiedjei]AFM23837.1 putative membrane protein [Desulfomonile tiedjei DSM 6799]
MSNGKLGWSVLWKTEDWLAVWIGFLIIGLVLAGLTVKPPKFKWATEGEFKTFVNEMTPVVDNLAKQAAAKGEQDLQTQAAALKAAMEKGDRKAVGDAAKKLESTAKNVKDKDLKKKGADLGKQISGNAGNLIGKVFSSDNILWSIYIAIGILILSVIALSLLGVNVGLFVIGFPIVFIIAWISLLLAGNYTINVYGLEYVLWCLFLGLFISNVIGVPDWLKPAVQTEFYIKTGLVVLGAGILFGEIIQAGALGILQAVLVVGVVWYMCYWIARKLQVDEEFSAILASAVSICGVSAAIATSGAIKGDPKKLSYTTSIVLICAVPMMVLQPIISKYFGIPDAVAGAWLGGTLDTSGSVVAAGSLISETAMKVGVIVKMSQNVLIGVAAFILAVVWTFKKAEEVPGGEKPGAIEIWNRFPKFVLGFMIASLIFSFLLPEATVKATKGVLSGLRTYWFALAFVSIGLETRFAELATLGGGRPAIAFLIAQGINILWTLLLAYLIFGGILFAAPAF